MSEREADLMMKLPGIPETEEDEEVPFAKFLRVIGTVLPEVPYKL